ncbi:extracellular solute-binding protein [Sporomusa acidovorans]|uniref:Molybdate ABC transporter periplasmic substrate-binding protein n=1 Tax=Sporomusa acidovorans (strain ATCC 49682 / DSM 3132 / Mol) TaxID=1123286 RepID=A0ABZ3IW48_SPOA4|nr:extracellular solute-binding protein [Sporomusa acidovorans]OZC13973.1 molybdate ABC transporter periplasmic substrate-binding protein [Sporomusa acidovorans DSM 3132]SDF21509.1 tungstate/molybdate binding protein [Sporomusa acidovorans]
MGRIIMKIIGLFLCLACIGLEQPSQAAENQNDALTEVIVFHAGSLSGPFQKAAKAYKQAHPGIKITLEGGGSREAARKVTELKRPCDIVASADYETIDKLLMPEYAKFNIFFARNKTVVAFTDKSKYADEITANNWYDILSRPDVRYGHTDPNLDPGGYRAVLTLQLAEKYYHKPGLYQKLINNFPPDNIVNDGKTIQAMLNKGELDYFFFYESSAKQGGYRYITLPAQLDFSSSDYTSYYKQAKLTLTGKTPGSTEQVHGQPIIYGLTLVNNAPHAQEALQFMHFLLTDGQKYLNDAGFISMNPRVRSHELPSIPAELKDIVKPLNMKN